MIHYHGGPITPETAALTAWRGRHAFVSWRHKGQLEQAASTTQSFALDNGAYSAWLKGEPVHDWHPYYEWVQQTAMFPSCDWAVIPDVIEGGVKANDALIDEWPLPRHIGVPVWHLDEPIGRLKRLARDWPRVALGSSAEYNVAKPSQCLARLAKVLPLICDDRGVPLVKLHGLRMLREEIISLVPLSSGDSTNVARNVSLDKRWKGTYAPRTENGRAMVLTERIEHPQTPLDIRLLVERFGR